LDMPSKDKLKAAIKQFEGTVIVVSHDRDFLQGLTDKVFEFIDHGVKEHVGDINEFLRLRAAENFRQFELDKAPNELTAVKKSLSKKENKLLRELKKELRSIEGKISTLEAKIAEADAKLQDPEQFEKYVNDQEFFKQYEGFKQELEGHMNRWEVLALEIDE